MIKYILYVAAIFFFSTNASALTPADFKDTQYAGLLEIQNVKIIGAREAFTDIPYKVDGNNIEIANNRWFVWLTLEITVKSYLDKEDVTGGDLTTVIEQSPGAGLGGGACPSMAVWEIGGSGTKVVTVDVTVISTTTSDPQPIYVYMNPWLWCGHDYLWSNIYTTFYTVNAKKLEISSSVRIAQRVFEPSAGSGQIDLVTGKPWAGEVTVKATNVTENIKNELLHVEAWIGSKSVGQSASFRLSDAKGTDSKIFVFGQSDSAGSADIEFRIVPDNPIIGILEAKDIPKTVRSVNFKATKMSILVSKITGCDPSVVGCFKAPSSQEDLFFKSKQVPFAEKTLPISSGGLTLNAAPNYSSSIPSKDSNFKSILRDAGYLWRQKKLGLNRVGVFLVGEDYLFKQLPKIYENGIGATFPHRPEIMFISAKDKMVLSHEIVHSLVRLPLAGVDVEYPHSDSSQVEGVGDNVSQLWINHGESLDTTVQFAGLANNIFSAAAFNDSSENYTFDKSAYNDVFKEIILPKVDPKVVLITGVVDAAGKIYSSEITRGDAFLDDSVIGTPNILVEGLDSSGRVVSSVQTSSVSEIEIIQSSGQHSRAQSDGFLFTATLPDPGNIDSIRVTKATKIILAEKVDKQAISLSTIINGFDTSSFKVPGILAKISLALVDLEFKKYETFKAKNKKKEAAISLLIVREAINIALKDEIILMNGSKMSKKTIVQMIDQELKLLK